MAVPRYLEKFEDSAGSITYTFPTYQYEMESRQSLTVPSVPATGAHYNYDQLGTLLAPKRNATEIVRFMDVQSSAANLDTDIDNLRSKLYRSGRGKLYALDASGTRRWAWARLAAMPQLTLQVGQLRWQPVILEFDRFSDWYGTTQSTTNVTLNEATETFSITNDGNARVYNAVFICKGTFVNPRIENTTNGYVLQSTRDGSAAGHWLRFDAGKRRVEFSTDSGVSYIGDFANFVRQSGQVQLMVLEPGQNDFSATFGGVPSGTLTVTFYPGYH